MDFKTNKFQTEYLEELTEIFLDNDYIAEIVYETQQPVILVKVENLYNNMDGAVGINAILISEDIGITIQLTIALSDTIPQNKISKVLDYINQTNSQASIGNVFMDSGKVILRYLNFETFNEISERRFLLLFELFKFQALVLADAVLDIVKEI